MYQHFFPQIKQIKLFNVLIWLLDKSCKRITKAIGNDGSVQQNFIWIAPKHHLYAAEELGMKFGLPVDGIESIRIFFIFWKSFIANTIM